MFLPKRIKIIIYIVITLFFIVLIDCTGIEERLAYWYYCHSPKQYEQVSGVVTDTYYVKRSARGPISADKESMTVTYTKDGQQNTCTLIRRKGDQIGNTVSLAIADKRLFKIVRVDNLAMTIYEGGALVQFFIWFFVSVHFFIDISKIKKDEKRIGKERVRIKNERQYREEMLARFSLPEGKNSKRDLRRTDWVCQCVLGGSLPPTICWFLTHMNLEYFIKQGYLFDIDGQGCYQFVEATRRLRMIGIWEYLVLKHEDDYYLLYHIEDGMMCKYDLNEAEVVSLHYNFYEYFLHLC